jgi:hypothetical protein
LSAGAAQRAAAAVVLVALLALLALAASPAAAETLRLQRTVTVEPPDGTQLHGLGSNRFIAAGIGVPSGSARHLPTYRTRFPVIDVAEGVVIDLQVPTGALLADHRDQLLDPEPAIAAGARARLVLYRPEEDRAGIVVESRALRHPAVRYLYVEFSARQGHRRHLWRLADTDGDQQLELLGFDAAGQQLHFYVEQYRPPPGFERRGLIPHVSKLVGPSSLSVHRLQTASGRRDVLAELTLPGRRGGVLGAPRTVLGPGGRWFAYAEYSELGVSVGGVPPVLVAIELGGQRRQVRTTAPVTPYGLSFDRSERYLFVGSHQLGRVARLDLAGGGVDRSVRAPERIHRLFVSPSGGRLIILATGKALASLSIASPGAVRRTRLPTPVDAGLASFFGSTVLETPDGKHVVLAGPPTPGGHGHRILYLTRLEE